MAAFWNVCGHENEPPSERTLSNPSVEVNNIVVGIKPNSTAFKSGKGDINVRPQSSGGDSIEIVRTEDAETKKSMVKFALYNTKTNSDNVLTWQENNKTEGNTIKLSDGDFVKSFRNMFLITDPEVALGADGELEVVFEGSPSL